MNHILWISLVVAATGPGTAFGASRAACTSACAAQIAACQDSCVGFGGGRFGPGGTPIARACKAAVLKTCRRLGTQTCETPSATTTTTTMPGGSSSSTTATVASTTSTSSSSTTATVPSSTTTTAPPAGGLAGLIGTWEFRFTIISTFIAIYDFDHVELVSGIPTLIGSDEFGDFVIASRTADLGTPGPYEFAMLDPGPILCDFYLFNRTGTSAIAGEHYNTSVAFDGTCDALIGGPDPLTGARLATLLGRGVDGGTGTQALAVRERIEVGAASMESGAADVLKAMEEVLTAKGH